MDMLGTVKIEMKEEWGLPDVRAELPTTEANKSIRFFYIPNATSSSPQDDCKVSWALCDSNSLTKSEVANLLRHLVFKSRSTRLRLSPILLYCIRIYY